MFDCFCPRTFEWELGGATAPASSENVPLETFPNLRPAAVTDGPAWWLASATFVAAFLHHLHVWWVLGGAYLRWCALLICTIDTLLLGGSMLPRSSWKYRLQRRPYRHIPEYLRINFALVLSVITIHSNLAAIAGLLMDDGARHPKLLLPYIVLTLLGLTVEFSHLLSDRLTAPRTLPDPGEANHWKCLALLQCCNLSIMSAVYFDIVPRSGASSPASTASILQVVHDWYRDFSKTHAREFSRS